MKTVLAAALGAALVLSAAEAAAAPVRVQPLACPDRIEDRLDRQESRRDARVAYSLRDVREDRRDRRESRRDEAVDVCPVKVVHVAPYRH